MESRPTDPFRDRKLTLPVPQDIDCPMLKTEGIEKIRNFILMISFRFNCQGSRLLHFNSATHFVQATN